MVNHYAIAVIGHVDHGKTSLVRALTGLETDRLVDEKARGLSIELGFAHRKYVGGTIDFIDAPGHEDFIRTMVSGTSGVPVVLLVVSATDGFERQTEEHLGIAAQLGIRHMVVALTKVDLVPQEQREEVLADVSKRLTGTGFDFAPIVTCSSETGEGLDDLHEVLKHQLSDIKPPRDLGGFFLPVDRVFSAIGSGTIVTGTLKGGTIRASDCARLEPASQSITVRKIQTRGEDVDVALPGARVALNLRGVATSDIERGDVICAPDIFHASQQINVSLRLSREMAHPLRAREEVRVHLGSGSYIAKVYPLEQGELQSGETRFVQLRFSELVLAHPGQTFIVRRLSPAGTLAGGIVLDPVAPNARRGSEKTLRLLSALMDADVIAIAEGLFEREQRGVERARLARLARVSAVALEDGLADLGDNLLAPLSIVHRAETEVLDTIDKRYEAQPDTFGISVSEVRGMLSASYPVPLVDTAIASLVDGGQLALRDGVLGRCGYDPLAALTSEKRQMLFAIRDGLQEGELSPPDLLKDLTASTEQMSLLSLLIGLGEVVKLRNQALKRDVVFHADAIEVGASRLRAAFPFPTPFKTGEARELLQTSRKFIVPLLEYYDATGQTVRSGDTRFCAPHEQ